MSAVNRGLRQATRSLRLHRCCPPSALRPLGTLKNAAGPLSIAATHTRSSFSTMASLQSASAATPSPSAGKGYDPEILDIASYVHNKKVDSELAVSGQSFFFPSFFSPSPFCNLLRSSQKSH